KLRQQDGFGSLQRRQAERANYELGEGWGHIEPADMTYVRVDDPVSKTLAPVISKRCGRCAAIAPVTNHVVAKTNANSGIAARGAGAASIAAWASFSGGGALGIDSRFSESPIRMCSPAHMRQAPRQPKWPSKKAENGQPTVLAKPAISVIPVIGPRAARPYSPVRVANAGS